MNAFFYSIFFIVCVVHSFTNLFSFHFLVTGSYSCLRVSLLFKREFSYYLIQIYIPCCMLVIVSWVSFWLDPNATVARVSLGVTTLLSMATQISGINASQPPVSYTKAIDVWTGVCLTFVFGALLEFALVNYASRSDAHRAALKQQQAAFAAQRKWDLEQHAAAMEADHIDERGSAFAMVSVPLLASEYPTTDAIDRRRTKAAHIHKNTQPLLTGECRLRTSLAGWCCQVELN